MLRRPGHSRSASSRSSRQRGPGARCSRPRPTARTRSAQTRWTAGVPSRAHTGSERPNPRRPKRATPIPSCERLCGTKSSASSGSITQGCIAPSADVPLPPSDSRSARSLFGVFVLLRCLGAAVEAGLILAMIRHVCDDLCSRTLAYDSGARYRATHWTPAASSLDQTSTHSCFATSDARITAVKRAVAGPGIRLISQTAAQGASKRECRRPKEAPSYGPHVPRARLRTHAHRAHRS